jgi:hypothetical protein
VVVLGLRLEEVLVVGIGVVPVTPAGVVPVGWVPLAAAGAVNVVPAAVGVVALRRRVMMEVSSVRASTVSGERPGGRWAAIVGGGSMSVSRRSNHGRAKKVRQFPTAGLGDVAWVGSLIRLDVDSRMRLWLVSRWGSESGQPGSLR